MVSFLNFNKPSVAHTIESTAQHFHPQVSEGTPKVAQTATYITRRLDGTSTETHIQTITQNGYPTQNKMTIHKDAYGQVIDQQHEKFEGDTVSLMPHTPEAQSTNIQVADHYATSPTIVNPKRFELNWQVPSSEDFQHSIQKYFFEVQKQQNKLMSNILQLLKKLPAIDPEPFELVPTKAKVSFLALEPKSAAQVEVKEAVKTEK